MKHLFLLFIIFLFSGTFAESLFDLKKVEINPIISIQSDDSNWEREYERSIRHIEYSEGFTDTVTYILDGLPKIGFGHVIREGDSFTIPINWNDADNFVRKDFNWNIEAIMRLTDNELTIPLRGNKLLAMANFCYNCGIGSFMKNIFPVIKNGGDIKYALYKHTKYRKNRNEKYHISKGILNRRIWEYKLYMKGE